MNIVEQVFLDINKRSVDFTNIILALHKVNEDKDKISLSFIVKEYSDEELEIKKENDNVSCGNALLYVEFDKQDFITELTCEDWYNGLHINGAIFFCNCSECEYNGEIQGDVVFFEQRYDREPIFIQYDFYNKKYDKSHIYGNKVIYIAYLFIFMFKQIENFSKEYINKLNYTIGEYSQYDSRAIKDFKYYKDITNY